MKRFLTALAAVLTGFLCMAQTDYGGVVRFDRTVYDFGDIAENSGPVSCSFTVTNLSKAAVSITSVISSCGCTDVKWTRAEIAPGGSGKISATYKDEDGPYPFDKSLTVYVSALKKPVVLHLRGVVRKKGKSAALSYPVHFGPLALRSSEISVGNLSQGEVKSGESVVANIGNKPVRVEFKDVSDGLKVSVEDDVIPPGGVSRVRYTVTASRSRWGVNWYYATPVINGRVYASKGRPEPVPTVLGAEDVVVDPNPALVEGCRKIGFSAATKENFSSAQREGAPLPKFSQSVLTYGTVKAGRRVNATFNFTNAGSRPLAVYKVDSETFRIKVLSADNTVAAGASGQIRCSIDTRGLAAGDRIFVITVYTNSPDRPVIYLYVTGTIS